MITYFKHRINKLAVRIAGISFLVGNFLFLAHLAFPEASTLAVGLVFVVLFLVLHVLMFVVLFLNLLIRLSDYEENITAFIVCFLNIPLAFLYLNLL